MNIDFNLLKTELPDQVKHAGIIAAGASLLLLGDTVSPKIDFGTTVCTSLYFIVVVSALTGLAPIIKKHLSHREQEKQTIKTIGYLSDQSRLLLRGAYERGDQLVKTYDSNNALLQLYRQGIIEKPPLLSQGEIEVGIKNLAWEVIMKNPNILDKK